MKKLFTNFLGLALSVMVLASCSQMATYEQEDVTPEEVAAAKNGFNLTPYGTGGNENAALNGGGDCNTVCITPTSGSQYKATDSKTTTLNKGSKTLSVEVWNTLTTIEYRFLLNTTENQAGNLQYFDEVVGDYVNAGEFVNGEVFSVSRPLASGWKACDVVTEQWRQTGGGSQIVLDPSSYSLIGICTTTTIAKDSESSVCVENGTVNLTGTVTSFGTFTGGNIKIQQFNGVSYVDVVSEAVGDGILVYAFDPSSAGTYTFRAAYDGTGSNGFNNSVSSDITVLAIDCAPTCDIQGNEFTGVAVSCDETREAIYTFGSEDGVSYFKMQGGLTNFTGSNATVYINGTIVDFNSVSSDGWATGTVGDYTVGQRTPGGSSNRNIRVEGGVGTCDDVVVRIVWNSSNSGGTITGDWSVVDAAEVEYAPEVLGLTCPQ